MGKTPPMAGTTLEVSKRDRALKNPNKAKIRTAPAKSAKSKIKGSGMEKPRGTKNNTKILRTPI